MELIAFKFRHGREGGHPRNSPHLICGVSWIPASAVMTVGVGSGKPETETKQ
ncbi:MAG: hypothetical protein KJZ80_03810 [Hyphomicrobiaceae bacterium]|nr:hypothetical protein [Hyphomicrobiaceae bacterium]